MEGSSPKPTPPAKSINSWRDKDFDRRKSELRISDEDRFRASD